MVKMKYFVVAVLGLFFGLGVAYVPASQTQWMVNGRPTKTGLLLPPTPKEGNEGRAVTVASFTQKLDHSNDADPTTFQQRYFTNDNYYRNGGPGFIFIGGEGPASVGWMTSGMWSAVWGQEFNAYLFQLEHRYYGSSIPTSDLSNGNLIYLTSEQAIADLAAFKQAKAAELGITKWVVFGGSYSGNLAAWTVLKYPADFVGAVASSGPVLAETDFQQYLEVVGADLTATDPNCYAPVQEAVADLQSKLTTTAGALEISNLFSLCTTIDGTNDDNNKNLQSILYGNFQGVCQYNEISPSGLTVDDLCSRMVDTSIGTPLERYAAVNDLIMQYYGYTCTEYRYDVFIRLLNNSANDGPYSGGTRQWLYQSCNEFGYFQSTDSPNQPFGSDVTVDWILKECAVYGITPAQVNSRVDATNQFYGGKNPNTAKAIFPNGSFDPWHSLGVIANLPTGAQSVYITGTAHCADMYEQRVGEPPGLVQARNQIHDQLAIWLA